MQESSNPAFSDKLTKKIAKTFEASEHMTVSGSVVKTSFLMAVLIAVAAWTWGLMSSRPSVASGWFIGASIAGFILAMAIIFWRPSPVLITLYSAAQGVVLGAISFIFNSDFQGIVLQAITLTLAITLGMLFLFATGMVTVTQKLRSVILIATVGIFLFFMLTFLIGLFSSSFYDSIYSSSFSVILWAVIVIIAALNLLLDFDFIDRGAKAKLPKQMEWYAGFGLMVTLIWLYISILRLLAASRR